MFCSLECRLVVTWNKSHLRTSRSAKKMPALGTVRARLPLETSSLIYTEAVLMCLRSQGRVRIRAVLLGVVIGLGVASVFVVWTHEGVYMKNPVMRNNAGERM